MQIIHMEQPSNTMQIVQIGDGELFSVSKPLVVYQKVCWFSIRGAQTHKEFGVHVVTGLLYDFPQNTQVTPRQGTLHMEPME